MILKNYRTNDLKQREIYHIQYINDADGDLVPTKMHRLKPALHSSLKSFTSSKKLCTQT